VGGVSEGAHGVGKEDGRRDKKGRIRILRRYAEGLRFQRT